MGNVLMHQRSIGVRLRGIRESQGHGSGRRDPWWLSGAGDQARRHLQCTKYKCNTKNVPGMSSNKIAHPDVTRNKICPVLSIGHCKIIRQQRQELGRGQLE